MVGSVYGIMLGRQDILFSARLIGLKIAKWMTQNFIQIHCLKPDLVCPLPHLSDQSTPVLPENVASSHNT